MVKFSMLCNVIFNVLFKNVVIFSRIPDIIHKQNPDIDHGEPEDLPINNKKSNSIKNKLILHGIIATCPIFSGIIGSKFFVNNNILKNNNYNHLSNGKGNSKGCNSSQNKNKKADYNITYSVNFKNEQNKESFLTNMCNEIFNNDFSGEELKESHIDDAILNMVNTKEKYLPQEGNGYTNFCNLNSEMFIILSIINSKKSEFVKNINQHLKVNDTSDHISNAVKISKWWYIWFKSVHKKSPDYKAQYILAILYHYIDVFSSSTTRPENQIRQQIAHAKTDWFDIAEGSSPYLQTILLDNEDSSQEDKYNLLTLSVNFAYHQHHLPSLFNKMRLDSMLTYSNVVCFIRAFVFYQHIDNILNNKLVLYKNILQNLKEEKKHDKILKDIEYIINTVCVYDPSRTLNDEIYTTDQIFINATRLMKNIKQFFHDHTKDINKNLEKINDIVRKSSDQYLHNNIYDQFISMIKTNNDEKKIDTIYKSVIKDKHNVLTCVLEHMVTSSNIVNKCSSTTNSYNINNIDILLNIHYANSSSNILDIVKTDEKDMTEQKNQIINMFKNINNLNNINCYEGIKECIFFSSQYFHYDIYERYYIDNESNSLEHFINIHMDSNAHSMTDVQDPNIHILKLDFNIDNKKHTQPYQIYNLLPRGTENYVIHSVFLGQPGHFASLANINDVIYYQNKGNIYKITNNNNPNNYLCKVLCAGFPGFVPVWSYGIAKTLNSTNNN